MSPPSLTVTIWGFSGLRWQASKAFPSISGAIIHSDRGSQYTSASYRAELKRRGIVQSMNSDGGRCHDNARCEVMWARMKEELLYGRYDTKKMAIEELKTLIWRYFIIYWNNRRICSANGGLPQSVIFCGQFNTYHPFLFPAPASALV